MLGPRRLGVVVTVLVVVVPAGALTWGANPAVATPAPERPDTDHTVTRIEVYPNGSARWIVRIRTRLRTDAEVADYEAFQARFRENTSRFLDPFSERIRAVVRAAANATGREMDAEGFEASTSVQEVPRRWGVVTYAFTWTNFAARDGDGLVVGDAFGSGFFIAENDTLEIVAPTGYAVASVEPAPASREDGVVAWVGREDFAANRPLVRFAPAATPTPTPAPPTTAPAGSSGNGPSLALAALVALAVVGIGYALTRRGRPFGGTGGTESGTDGGGPIDGDGVVTDTERVIALLEANGGRMRQADAVDELGWSKSKTSRVLSKMADEGRVEKIQLGRENLIQLPDEE